MGRACDCCGSEDCVTFHSPMVLVLIDISLHIIL